jgi:hypothetical protein
MDSKGKGVCEEKKMGMTMPGHARYCAHINNAVIKIRGSLKTAPTKKNKKNLCALRVLCLHPTVI